MLLPLSLVLAACGRDDAPADNRSAGADPAGPAARESRPAPGSRPGGTSLAGLYEGGSGEQKNQLCIVEKGGETEFGMLVWGGNLHSCSGAGRAVAKGDRLSLAMAGDEACTIEATRRGGEIALPAKLPLGCEYYCAARASFSGASFRRVGDDVAKATDIAGDPLCD